MKNLEELTLEGCKKLVKVHLSTRMLKKLVVLNMRNCRHLKSFPSKMEMVSFQILIFSGCLKMQKLPEDLGRIKSLTELHIDRTSITELPLFGQQESIRSRWWTFGLLSKQQHPKRSVSLTSFHMLKSLNFSYCNLEQVPYAIGSLSCLRKLNLKGNNFTRFPRSLRQLSHLITLTLDCCKKLEVLHELLSSLRIIEARDCTSLCSITKSSKINTSNYSYLNNCPKLFTNIAIESQVSISETQCLESAITSQGSKNQFSSFLLYAGIYNNRCEFFHSLGSFIGTIDITYHGNTIPEWFKNKSIGNRVKVELPSHWCFNKFRGFGTLLGSLSDPFSVSVDLNIKSLKCKEAEGCSTSVAEEKLQLQFFGYLEDHRLSSLPFMQRYKN
ncbi:NB-ARC domains-containing protein [Tanacetum coccineum]|uniref:NB-ARC domains-containing protein n=1 Tax=Tanacetum coccineum TaxID=301880 RepID=A0ABQ5CGS7_9ASTR